MGSVEEWEIQKVCRCSAVLPKSTPSLTIPKPKENQWDIYEPENGLLLQFCKMSRIVLVRRGEVVLEVFDFSANFHHQSIRVYKKESSLLFLKKLKDTIYKCRVLFKGENSIGNCCQCYSVLQLHCADSASKIRVCSQFSSSLPLEERKLPEEGTVNDDQNDSPSLFTELELNCSSESLQVKDIQKEDEECSVIAIVTPPPTTSRENFNKNNSGKNEACSASTSTSTLSCSEARTSTKSILIKKNDKTRIVRSFFKEHSASSSLRNKRVRRNNRRLSKCLEETEIDEVVILGDKRNDKISEATCHSSGRKRGRKKKTPKDKISKCINDILKKFPFDSEDSDNSTARERFLKTMIACSLLDPKLLDVASTLGTLMDMSQ